MQYRHHTDRSSGSGNAQLHRGSVANAAVSVAVTRSRSAAVAVRGSPDIAYAVSRVGARRSLRRVSRERPPKKESRRLLPQAGGFEGFATASERVNRFFLGQVILGPCES